jgi:hypothetical protein
VKSTNYGAATHFTVFSSLPSRLLFWVHIFSSASCSQTPLIYVLPEMIRAVLRKLGLTGFDKSAKYDALLKNLIASV